MKLLIKDVNKSYFTLGAIIVLILLNLFIYFNFYFHNFGFPLDFPKNYWAIPAFWTAALEHGIFPQWTPFQNMGFPLIIFGQSSLYYPFLWLFPIFSVSYTLQSAVFFQILHILFGSIGMFFFLKYLLKSPWYALVGAIAFQFFGGFFGNASHVDIVRAFAISPWMFYAFTLNLEKPSLSRKVLLIPIIIFLIATGGYFGIFISSIFMMGLFIGLQTINGFWRGIGKQKSMMMGIALIILMILGLAISAVHLGPFSQYGSELTRFEKSDSDWQAQLTPRDFSAFFMSNKAIGGSKEFTSTFLPLPILIFACFLPLSLIKKYWMFFVILIVALLMAIGKPSILYQILTEVFPVLSISRFPIGDYRIFIVIPLLIFALSGLKAIIEGKFNLKSLLFRIGFVLSWFSYGIYSILSHGYGSRWIDSSYDIYAQPIFATLILGITLTLVSFYVFKFKSYNLSTSKPLGRFSGIFLTFFIVIIIVDGLVIIDDMKYVWVEEPFDKWYKETNIISGNNGNLDPHIIFKNLPEERPERLPHGELSGWLTGDYRTTLKGSGELEVSNIAKSNENYMNFMLLKWTPILLEPTKLDNSSKIYISDDFLNKPKIINQDNSVRQTFYGINDITYKISLNEPKLMVENEMYFPGWKATLFYADKKVELESVVVNDVFRSWNLPAGDYEMMAHFEFPNFFLYVSISLIAFFVWITIVIILWKKLKLTSHI